MAFSVGCLTKPYYQHAGVTIYHGDSREILPQLTDIDSIVTDPVWPNNKVPEFEKFDPYNLLAEILESVPSAKCLAIHLGCDSDPRILMAVPKVWPFFRICYLRYACPTRKGRVLYGGDVAYVFGKPPKSAPGRRVISGEFLTVSTKPDAQRVKLTAHREYGAPVQGLHPTPRRLQHVRWLVAKLCDGLVVDPFFGSGTTGLACKLVGYPCVGIEIEERYCEIAAKRLSQEQFAFEEGEEVA